MGKLLLSLLDFALTKRSSIMFNTNDVVRWRGDGSLETFGRGDDQVKIKVSFYYPTLGRELIHPGISRRARWRLGYY